MRSFNSIFYGCPTSFEFIKSAEGPGCTISMILLLRLCLREACATAIALAHAVGEARRSVHLQQTHYAFNFKT